MSARRHPLFEGGGEMGALMRALDWSATPLGPVETWPQSLRSPVSILLASKAQIVMFWGPDLVALYNDAYTPVFGSKHPQALGKPARECWAEIWDETLGPLFSGVLRSGEAFHAQDHRFFLERHGYLEETYFDVSYDPIRDESGAVGGIFCIVRETTAQVLEQRRLRALRDLSARSLSDTWSAPEACRLAAEAIGGEDPDVPFALIYTIDPDRKKARLEGAAGIEAGAANAPREIALGGSPREGAWPLDRVASSTQALVLDSTAMDGLPCGTWDEPPRSVVLLPVAAPGQPLPTAVVVAAVSPRRPLDEVYLNFFQTMAGHVSTAIATARAYEEERRRAEALAELDRAKTLFFTNVSHEFRTPLTLMLGPLEDALSQPARALAGASLETAHRNVLRLLKLVNALLDFSRLEADRVQASYEPTDLATLTRDLASAFRSAIEAGGLKFDVDCAPLPEPVYVDREMWEKIVLNLLSNALKFTFDGAIEVRLRAAGDRVELTIADTGVGVPEAELPRLFDRFHRVEGTRSRTHEGSGIGLALTGDLVRLHGGTIEVRSQPGRGTTFTVSLPFGSAHLPPDHVAASGATGIGPPRAEPYVEEALRWMVDASRPATAPPESSPIEPIHTGQDRGRVLVVDDNADMREYIAHVLEPHWLVETAADGKAALDAARARRPDLVLTDIMMPVLDGFGLVNALRGDAATRTIPVVLLSARAGEEARVEGLQSGADDYLVKPFSARELLARVGMHLELGRLRRSHELERDRLYALFEHAPAAFAVFRGATHQVEFANSEYLRITRRSLAELVGRPLVEAFPDLAGSAVLEVLDAVYATGSQVRHPEFELSWDRDRDGTIATEHFDWTCQPVFDTAGRLYGTAQFFFNVTEAVRGRERLELARGQAEAAGRAKDEFLAILSHELRNPLSPVRNAAHYLKLRGPQEGDLHRAVEMIDRQITHMVRLVDDLLDVSRITRGKLELRRERVLLGSVVEAIQESCGPEAEAKGVSFTMALPGESIVLHADKPRLVQAFCNLVLNAIKYTPAGGRIVFSVRRDGTELEASVRDDGIGIPKERLSEIFELFTQVEGSHDRQGGLGIGLTLVRQLVALHGGTVEARSEGLGHGSEFVVRLPLPQSVEAAGDATGAAQAPQVESRRVLVVDDNQDAAESLALNLQVAGHETRVAYDGIEGLAVADAFEPEIVILDIGMPGMGGLEVARRIRERPWGRAALVIALTGWGQREDRQMALEAGFDAHFTKPVAIDDLHARIATMGPPPPEAASSGPGASASQRGRAGSMVPPPSGDSPASTRRSRRSGTNRASSV